MIEHRTLGLAEARVDNGISAHFPGTFPDFGKNFFFGRAGHEGEWLAKIVPDLANDHIRSRDVAFEHGDCFTGCISNSPSFRSRRITKRRRDHRDKKQYPSDDQFLLPTPATISSPAGCGRNRQPAGKLNRQSFHALGVALFQRLFLLLASGQSSRRNFALADIGLHFRRRGCCR